MADSSAPLQEGAEATVKRNPHPDFKAVEASRPPFDTSKHFNYTQTPKPDWKPGQGANDSSKLQETHREIDPFAPGRPLINNYKLLISGVIPRPIGFISTLSHDGTANLAPYSFFNVISHNPPLFILGVSGGYQQPKDTLANLIETKECVINMISEEFIEAANYTALNSPPGVSEWPLSGLTPAKSKLVKPDRVQEAIFSVEAKLVETREWESKVEPGRRTGVLAIIEGVKFWVREDAVNEEGSLIDPAVLKPISRLGGIAYGRVTESFELPRPDYDQETKDPNIAKLAKLEADGQ
ncbi:flavo protein-like protein oxygenase [Pleomassaria siparia CBS 279.74]|uniref:Flavo protein-like protein oxygenase n=1 Tax=Pleomassaria siparia CBS 279.74 TaxID=1314801 RepID=A0A6G1KPW8_9PLEO|nr:flavo protein-like protein oxygenase [Pleomassaria siparia CBS 279.74]